MYIVQLDGNSNLVKLSLLIYFTGKDNPHQQTLARYYFMYTHTHTTHIYDQNIHANTYVHTYIRLLFCLCQAYNSEKRCN